MRFYPAASAAGVDRWEIPNASGYTAIIGKEESGDCRWVEVGEGVDVDVPKVGLTRLSMGERKGTFV